MDIEELLFSCNQQTQQAIIGEMTDKNKELL
jgi:hypothetical protein